MALWKIAPVVAHLCNDMYSTEHGHATSATTTAVETCSLPTARPAAVSPGQVLCAAVIAIDCHVWPAKGEAPLHQLSTKFNFGTEAGRPLLQSDCRQTCATHGSLMLSWTNVAPVCDTVPWHWWWRLTQSRPEAPPRSPVYHMGFHQRSMIWTS